MTPHGLTLRQFVPSYLLGPDNSAVPIAASARELPSAVLLVDIVGYTSLTEQYSRRGIEGAEHLGAILREAFAQIEVAALDHGGDIFSFAGDSAIALWVVTTEAELRAAVRQCVMAALAAQLALGGPHMLVNGAQMRFRMAVTAGLAALHIAGGHQGRWRCFVAGEAVHDAAAAVGLGESDAVCVAPSAHTRLDGFWPGEFIRGGLLQLPVRAFQGRPLEALRATSEPTDIGQPAPARSGQAGAETEAGLRQFVPDFLLDLLDAGHADWLSEFRTVTTLFIGMRSMTQGESPAPPPLGVATRDIQCAVERYDGCVTRVGCDDKGVHALCVWGVPGKVHEDDPARALHAALDIRVLLAGYGVSVGIGIGTGRVLCGLSGGLQRCEYTVSGTTVNLAAHLMAASRGEVLCDNTTRRRAGLWLFDRLARDVPKVSTAQLPVWSVQAASAAELDIATSLPAGALVGRGGELRNLRALMDRLAAGHGGVAIVEGAAGAGKTALVHAAAAEARQRGVRVVMGTATSIERRTPYFAWRAVLLQLLGLPHDASPTAARDALHARCASQPHLLPWLPALEDVLPVATKSTAATFAMNEGSRANNLAAVVTHLVHQAAEAQPATLVFDDVHWLDSASWELATRVQASCRALLLLMVGRDGHDDQNSAPIAELRHLMLSSAGARLITLRPLSVTDTKALLLRATSARSADLALLQRIHAQTGGHALFAVEVLKSLLESGSVVVRHGHASLAAHQVWRDGVALPASVDQLIASRFDRLAVNQQMTLKVASVLGVTFDLQTLAQTHPNARLEEVSDQLLSALDTGFIVRTGTNVRTEPRATASRGSGAAGTDFSFAHALTRDVVYQSLPFRERRLLHAAAARAIESAHAGEHDAVLPALAHHWSSSDNVQKAVHYLHRAGEQAFMRHGYREAIDLLGQALVLLERSVGSPLHAACERLIGHAWLGLGNLAAARRALESSLALEGRPVPRARIALAWGAVVEGATQLGIRLTARGGRAAAESQRQAPTVSEAHALFRLGHVAWFQSDTLALLYAALRGVNTAERNGCTPDLARLFAGMATIAGAAGLRQQAGRYLNLSYSVAQRLNEPTVSAQVDLFAAIYCAGVGDWGRALPSIEAAMASSRAHGDLRQLDECAVTAAYVCMHSGQLGRAMTLFGDCVRRGRARGDNQTTGWGLLGIARIYLLQGAFERAAAALVPAEALAADRLSAIELHGQRALVRLHARDERGSEQDAALALRLVRQSRPLSFSTLVGTAAVSQVYLILAARATRSRDLTYAEACVAQLRASLAALQQFADVFPIGRPLCLLLKGQWAAQSGRPRRARMFHRQAADAAESLRLPYEKSCAGAVLGGLALPWGEAAR